VREDRITPLRAWQYALVLLGLLMLWPAWVNGVPFLFRDTTAYVHAADAAMLRATGHATAWSNDTVVRASAVRAVAMPAGEAAAAAPVLLGRSIFYGLLGYLGAVTGSLWTVVVVQALVVGAVIVGVVRHLVDPASPRFAGAVAAATLALATTPLAWFASMVMPDVMTGLAVVAAAVLLAGWQREQWRGRAFWFAVLAYAALVHSSHVLILLTLGSLALLFARARARAGAAVVIVAALVGVTGEAAFARGIEAMTGSAPIRPPFVTARLAEDGPARAWLDRHCGTSDFHLCRYRARLPINSDLFLWSEEPASGVFKAVPVAEQRALSAEQPRFVWAVVRDRPIEVAAVAVAAIGRQFAAWRLSEFNHDLYPDDARAITERLPPGEQRVFMASRAFRGVMPIHLAEIAALAWAVLGIAGAVWLTLRQRRSAAAGFAAVLVGGWMIDVMVCGALSTPHDRYQARILWVLALVPMILVAARFDAAPRRRD